MSAPVESDMPAGAEKHGEFDGLADHVRGRQLSIDPQDQELVQKDQETLHRALKGRHMQMIAMLVTPTFLSQYSLLHA